MRGQAADVVGAVIVDEIGPQLSTEIPGFPGGVREKSAAICGVETKARRDESAAGDNWNDEVLE